MHKFGLFLVLLLFTACSSSVRSSSGLVRRLKNQGPVPLSTENPYLRGNLLVAQEARNSPVIRGFIRHRGAPAAIELEKGMFNPLFMYFYYPASRHVYQFEALQDTWVVEGPHRIPREKLTSILRITRGQRGRPLIAEDVPATVRDSQQFVTIPPDSNSSFGNEPSGDPFIDRLNRVEAQRNAFKSGPDIVGLGEADLGEAGEKTTPTVQAERSFDELVAASASKPAELTPKGDLVHYVTYEGETLGLIARWYTLEQQNSGKLARINNLKQPHKLALGDVVVIPSYLLRNRNRLTEDSVNGLISLDKQAP